MNNPALLLPRLRPDQYAIAMNPEKVVCVAAGRRYGKSTLGGCVALVAASQGWPVAWCCPVYKNGFSLWRFARRAVAQLRAAGLVRVSEAERRIEFISSGGFLGLYSMDNSDSILGDGFKIVVVDEAGRIPEAVITETILPTLSDMDGSLWLIGTPRGMNYFFEWFERGLAGEPGFASFTAPSYHNPNPFIKLAYERAKLITPELKFRQEWDAEFIPDGSGAFMNIDECAIAAPQKHLVPGHSYSTGIDFGRSQDYTAIVTYDQTIRAIVDVVRINEIDYSRQRRYIMDAFLRFKPLVMLAEANSIGNPIITELLKLGLPVKPFITTSATKNELVDHFALALQNKSISLLPDPVFIKELKRYSGKMLPSGLWQYGSPNYHDDTVIGAMLAYYAGATKREPIKAEIRRYG